METGQPITRFSLTPLGVPYEAWNGKTQLLCDGVLTPYFVDGCDLKAQFQSGDYYVLAAEHDCAFEEAVSVTLLAKDFKPLARSTVPHILYPVVGAPSYWFDKLVWKSARSFELHIKDLSHHFLYTIRDFSIPFVYPRLGKRRVYHA